MALGKLDGYMQKNASRPVSTTLHKNYLQIDKKKTLHIKHETLKQLEEK